MADTLITVPKFNSQTGEGSLSYYANKFGTTVDALAQYNNIKNPNLIQVGSTLKIPTTQAPPATTTNPPTPLTWNTTGSPVMTADSMTKTVSPVSIPPAPTYTPPMVTPIANTTSDVPQFLKDYLSATPPTNPINDYNNLYNQSGIDTKQQAVNESTNRINALNAELQGITAAQTAKELKLKEEGISSGAIKGRSLDLERQNAIASLPIQAQILAEQATLTGNTALLQQAQDKLNQTFKIQTDYNAQLFNYNQSLRDAVYQYATKQQQQQLDAQKQADQNAFTLLQNNLNYAQQLAGEAIQNGQGSLAGQITALDPNSPTYTQDLARLAGQIQGKTTSDIIGSASTGYFNVVKDAQGNIISRTPVTGGAGGGGGVSSIGSGLSVTQKADFAEDLVALADQPDRATALNLLNKNQTALIAKYGKTNYEAMVGEVDRLFPKTSTAETNQAAKIFGSGNFSNTPIDDRISQLKSVLGASATKSYLREQLLKDGYPTQEVINRTQDITEQIGGFFQGAYNSLFGK